MARKSNDDMETESAVRGQVIRTETGPERGSHPIDEKETLMGRPTTGGPTDVGHSLSGAGNVVTYNDKKPGKAN